ncbi:MAG TPA: nucleotide exchange factor GrpE [Dehalococcoidia bacterium]|nr:nucleotide exchange factor GrpE [Dehalococcoidia bacterium]
MLPKEAKENENNEPENESGEIESPTGLEEELAAEKQKAAEYLTNWQRAQADFINYKRRTEEERAEFNSYANANLVLAILPVLDDLERALEAIPAKYKKNDWVEGVRLVAHKFKTILEGQGVKPIKAMGEAFDPNYHEALRQDKGKEGMVVEEYQKGYLLHDKLIRPARVVVGNGEADTKEEE